MSRINIRKYRAFAQLVEYARSVEPRVCSADETAAIEEAALDIARAGGYSFVEAKRALESVLNVVPPVRYIVKPLHSFYVGRKHAGKRCEVWFLREDVEGEVKE